MTDPRANLPEGKKTALGLYVTAKQAYAKWKAEPDKVETIDVRTPEEYLFGLQSLRQDVYEDFVASVAALPRCVA